MLRPYTRAQLTFDLIREIGQVGRNSRTYVARDHQLDAEIVIKEISKTRLASAPSFFEESKALYASIHPNVVQVYYACEDNEVGFIGMPYYRRGSIATVMGAQRMTVREIVTFGCNVLSGLHNIHSKGLMHFDVKPDNVLVSDRNEGLLSDFGLAKQMNFAGTALQDRLYNKMIAPEATRGDQFDRTFDIYQFGLMLYRMCHGEDFFNAQVQGIRRRCRLRPRKLSCRLEAGPISEPARISTPYTLSPQHDHQEMPRNGPGQPPSVGPRCIKRTG